jgi:hypothetical protein
VWEEKIAIGNAPAAPHKERGTSQLKAVMRISNLKSAKVKVLFGLIKEQALNTTY